MKTSTSEGQESYHGVSQNPSANAIYTVVTELVVKSPTEKVFCLLSSSDVPKTFHGEFLEPFKIQNLKDHVFMLARDCF